ncbi:MAG TPA: MaoC family dehydratase [Cellulomonas sp.]|nr:MaoC family dehydratase [Cellulomonas sp.]HEX5332213.1 MaoC family dehydratase [Cellulomonas sp.]
MADLPSLLDVPLGPSAWRPVTQAEVDAFADLTGDHNPIHVDPDFASGTPFGGTIAHGYLTLSLIVPTMAELVEVVEVGTAVNYGLDKLRFPAPVRVGSRIRATTTLTTLDDVPGGVQAHWNSTIEVEGSGKPAVVAHMVVRYYA